ncbi:MAG: YraN family protein [Eubacteriales bacterium]|jgi:putative endonuclease
MTEKNRRSAVSVGKRGEDAACAYLESKGYVIAARNVRLGRGEIDIVADSEAENATAMVEVKLRRAGTLKRPGAAVTKEKQAKITSAASAYVAQKRTKYPPRYDVIELWQDGDGFEINHIRGAFFGAEPQERFASRLKDRYN